MPSGKGSCRKKSANRCRSQRRLQFAMVNEQWKMNNDFNPPPVSTQSPLSIGHFPLFIAN
jgi:hypothetical protein